MIHLLPYDSFTFTCDSFHKLFSHISMYFLHNSYFFIYFTNDSLTSVWFIHFHVWFALQVILSIIVIFIWFIVISFMLQMTRLLLHDSFLFTCDSFYEWVFHINLWLKPYSSTFIYDSFSSPPLIIFTCDFYF